MKLEHGVLTISLDCELYWGVRDKRSIAQYKENLLGVRGAVTELLRVFGEYGIHATWAIVGFLFFHNVEQLKANLPALKPKYFAENLSPYKYIETSAELAPDFHFAPDIIGKIGSSEGQEIATHTFSHYCCLEAGQSVSDFAADLDAAIKIAEQNNISIESVVFPRNQCNPDYLRTLRQRGISSYRGNGAGWVYQATDGQSQDKLRRGLRFLDAFMNLFGHCTHDFADCIRQQPFNFPASRLLRPYSKRLAVLDGLRLKRITKAMDHAAEHREIFHLWWHPHNFGANTKQNIEFLCSVLDHYQKLQQTRGMKSFNMRELSLQATADCSLRWKVVEQA